MDYLTTVRVLDTDYKLKDEEAARIHHTHKVAEIEDMPDSKALLPTGGGAGQVLAKKSGTDYDVEWQDMSLDNKSLTAIHSMYNQYNGQHVYTGTASEISSLVESGWKDEGPKFYAFV